MEVKEVLTKIGTCCSDRQIAPPVEKLIALNDSTRSLRRLAIEQLVRHRSDSEWQIPTKGQRAPSLGSIPNEEGCNNE